MVFCRYIPILLGSLFISVVSSSVFASVTPQTLHACYLLVLDGHKEESSNALMSSFESPSADLEFLCNQFLTWSAGDNCEMSSPLNKSAYFVIQGDKKSAVNVIEGFFPSFSKDIHDFSESFFDWGLSVIELDKLVREK